MFRYALTISLLLTFFSLSLAQEEGLKDAGIVRNLQTDDVYALMASTTKRNDEGTVVEANPQLYVMSPNLDRRLAEEIIEALNRGVNVQILVGEAGRASEFIPALQRGGAEVRTSPVSAWAVIKNRKTMIAEGVLKEGDPKEIFMLDLTVSGINIPSQMGSLWNLADPL